VGESDIQSGQGVGSVHVYQCDDTPACTKEWSRLDIGKRPWGIAIGDADNDGLNVLILGNHTGEVFVYKAKPPVTAMPWISLLLDSKPPIPTLIAPEADATMDNGCSDGSNLIIWDFDWSDVPNATEYNLWVKAEANTVPYINSNTVTSAYHLEGYGWTAYTGTWFWKVRAKVGGEWQDWSEERAFYLEPVETDCTPPTLYLPRNYATMDNGCSDRSNQLIWDFSWSDVPNATEYNLYVILSGAAGPNIDSNIPTSFQHMETYSGPNDYDEYGPYLWKVRAKIDKEWQVWSTERTFYVEPIDTDCP